MQLPLKQRERLDMFFGISMVTAIISIPLDDDTVSKQWNCNRMYTDLSVETVSTVKWGSPQILGYYQQT
jgi:hypothetical protein